MTRRTPAKRSQASRYPTLTSRQEAFVLEYFRTGNATQSYREVYKPAWSAAVVGVKACELLKNGKVQVRLKELEDRLRRDSDVTVDEIRAELKRVGFSDMRNYVKWGPRMGVQLRPSGALGEKSRCVKEVSETTFKGERTITFKLHDKLSALDKLARHLGMYAEADGKALAQGAIAIEMFRKMMDDAERPGGVTITDPPAIAGV